MISECHAEALALSWNGLSADIMAVRSANDSMGASWPIDFPSAFQCDAACRCIVASIGVITCRGR